MEPSHSLIRYIDRSKTINRANKQKRMDHLVRLFLFLLAAISASAVLFIIGFILVKGVSPFFKTYEYNGESYRISFFEFLTGLQWEPSPTSFGAGYIILNTIYIALLTILLTAPISIMTALVIVKMSPKPIGFFLNSVTELLASVPSVIFGMFGKSTITVWVKNLSNLFGYQSAGGLSVLSTVLVLTMMSIPTVTMLSITAIKSVNKNLELGSLALGASKSQTNFKVVLSASKSGIFAGLILGISRALGEATAVTMVCGISNSGPNFNLFDTTTTLTSTMLTGLGEASGAKYDIKFSLGILLIFIIILSNLSLNALNNRLTRGKRK